MPLKTVKPAKPVWFPFYVQDFLASTHVAMMTTEEIGAYLLMLIYAWNDDSCSLPDDDEALARLTRLGTRWPVAAGRVRACFLVRQDRLVNERLLLERKKANALLTKCSKAGKVGSLKRWGSPDKPSETQEKITNAIQASSPCINKTITNHNHNHKESSPNQTLNLSKTDPSLPMHAVSKTDTVLCSSTMNGARFEQFWNAWPKKRAKETAYKAWQRIEKDGLTEEQFQEILQAIDKWKRHDDWTKEQGKYIPLPATWLNGKRWCDQAQCEGLDSGTFVESFLARHQGDERTWMEAVRST